MTRTGWTRWTRWTVGLALAAAACGGDDDDGGTTGPTPTIGVSLAGTSVSVVAGQSGTVAATVTRGGGYTGAVNLSVEGAPSTVTATANPASLAGNVTASTITLATTSATPAGTYNLTVRAAGSSAVQAVTTPLTLTVTAPQPTAGFTVVLAAPTVTVTQGAAAQAATLNITRTGGFAGAVTVTASGAPAGLTVTPAAATTGNSVGIQVSATTAVAPGTYQVTLSAAGAGIATPQTTQLGVVVQAPAATPDFTITAGNVTVAQAGPAQNATVTIARTGGFAGGVTLTTTGAPAGLTVTPPATAVTAGTATIAVQATNAVAPGTYTITVNAAGAGITGAKTATFTVTVSPAVQVGDFAIAVTPTTVQLQQGQSATATVSITRTGGFAGPVDVTVTGLPNGVTYAIVTSLLANRTPASAADPVAGNSATIRFTAAPGAATGNFTFTVNATAAGITGTKAVQGTGSVAPASTGGGNVGLAFCAGEAPLWVGYQSEGGAWQRATVAANGTVQVPVSGRGAVAYVVQAGSGAQASYTTNVIYGASTDLGLFGANLCENVTGGKTVTGTLAGVGPTDQASITLGGASADITGTSFRIDEVQPGPRDLLAVRSSIDLTTFSIAPNRVVLRRNLNVADGGTIPVVDFGAAESFAPVSANLTVAGAAANEVTLPIVALTTANGASAAFFTGIGGLISGTTGPQRYYGLPADRLAAGDLHFVTAAAFPRSGDSFDATQGRIAGTFFRTVTDRTVTLGPALTAPTVSSSNSPHPRPRLQLAVQTQYGDAVSATFIQSTAASFRAASMTALASYRQGGNWDLTFPDFSGAPGFDQAWLLRPATQTQWTVSASGGAIVTIGKEVQEGSTFLSAIRTGTITTASLARGFAVRQPLVQRATSVEGVRREALRLTALANRMLRARH